MRYIIAAFYVIFALGYATGSWWDMKDRPSVAKGGAFLNILMVALTLPFWLALDLQNHIGLGGE